MTPPTPPAGRENDISMLKIPEKKPAGKWLKLLTWTVILLAAVFGLGMWAMQDDAGDVRYRTRPAFIGDITVTVSATGNLQPTNKVDVSSELSGIVKSVEVDFNDQVKVGQVLARLDTLKLSAQISQSQATVDSARAKVLQAEATIKETRAALDRLHEVGRLSNNKAIAKGDLETAQAALDRAKADLAGAHASVSLAEATLQLNRTDLAKTEIKSPINGIVLTRSVEPGQTVAASLQAPVLFTLAENLAQMELHVDVDEADVGQVQNGQAATFAVDAYPDRSYPAEITQIRFGAKTTNNVVTYETLLTVDNSDLSLRPGMTATAEITVTRVVDALLVANAALRFDPKLQEKTRSGGTILSKLMPRPSRRPERPKESGKNPGKSQQVWTLVDGRPVAVPVTVGLTDGASTQIVAGDVKPGLELVIDRESQKK
ncbi:MAG: efflux transporter periplasmic adaptor subunit [Desulfobacterales bacterium GWB2_56_26]|nr:MAG: efflux transporter periplasmic adaptor subunit [Desulfobacterales bacterium GWB2_56_26]